MRGHNVCVEKIQIRGHNVCFYAELLKIIPNYHQILELWIKLGFMVKENLINLKLFKLIQKNKLTNILTVTMYTQV